MGLDGVTLRDITKRSGDNLGSITYHFQSKENLLRAVAETAITDGKFGMAGYDLSVLDDPSLTPEHVHELVRTVASHHIHKAFSSDLSDWCHKVVHQLMIREDELHEIYEKRVIDPEQAIFTRVFRAVFPDITEEEIFARSCFSKMPLNAHIIEQKMILRRLGQETYSDEYLQRLEEMIVQHTMLTLGFRRGRKN